MPARGREVGRHREGGDHEHRLARAGDGAHRDHDRERRLGREREVPAQHEQDAAEQKDPPAPAVGQPAGERPGEDRPDARGADGQSHPEVALAELVADVQRQRDDEDPEAREDGPRRGEDEKKRACDYTLSGDRRSGHALS